MLTKSEILVQLCLDPSRYPRLLGYLCVLHIDQDGRPVKVQRLLRELELSMGRLDAGERGRFFAMAEAEIKASSPVKIDPAAFRCPGCGGALLVEKTETFLESDWIRCECGATLQIVEITRGARPASWESE